jgi:hypothetical protein
MNTSCIEKVDNKKLEININEETCENEICEWQYNLECK